MTRFRKRKRIVKKTEQSEYKTKKSPVTGFTPATGDCLFLIKVGGLAVGKTMLFDARCYIKLNGCVGNFLTAFRVINRISDICRFRAQTGNTVIAVWQLANGRDAVTRRCHSANFDMSASYQLYTNVINVPGGHCVRSGIDSDCVVIGPSVVTQQTAWQMNQILSDYTEAVIIHTCIGGSEGILLTTNDKIRINGKTSKIIPLGIRRCVKLTNNVYIFIRENNAFQVKTIYIIKTKAAHRKIIPVRRFIVLLDFFDLVPYYNTNSYQPESQCG